MNDKRLESIIGQLLRTGVLLSAAMVVAGGILYLLRSHAAPVDFHTFVADGAQNRTVQGIVLSALHGQSQGLIQLGLVLLILTPVARVVMALVGFALEHDRLYAAVSLVVLVILALSLIHAR